MRRQAGSATPLMLAVAGLVIVLGLALANAGVLLAGKYQAAVAADAAALAAAPVTFRPFGAHGSPWEEAARFAAINGATLVSCRCPRDPSWRVRTVAVEVSRRVRLIGGVSVRVGASSRARFDPAALVGGETSSVESTRKPAGDIDGSRPP